MSSEYSVSVERTADPVGYAIKIVHEAFEMNVWVQRDELTAFAKVIDTKWESSGSMRIGTSAGAPVFWSCDDGRVSVLVGHDDETWDFGVSIPETTLLELVRQLPEAGKSSI